jgi:hypothetical protein
VRVPAADGAPRWLLVVGAPPVGDLPRVRLRDAVRAGVAARMTAPDAEPGDYGNDGRGTALEER